MKEPVKHYDLHNHTTASDGAFTPTELVRQAAEIGLGGLAITDHDTFDGLSEAAEAAKKLPISVIFGVELSCEAEIDGRAHEVHILGLGVDPLRGELPQRLQEMQAHRRQRGAKILAKLAELGMPLGEDWLADYAEQGSLGRGLIARKLVEAGYAADNDEVFARWLSPGRPAYVPRLKLSAEEAVRLLHENGALAVLAHPVQVGDDRIISMLAAAGVDAMECVHPDHDGQTEQHYRRLAAEYGLAVSGGSDCHTGGLGGHFATGAELAELWYRRRKWALKNLPDPYELLNGN